MKINLENIKKKIKSPFFILLVLLILFSILINYIYIKDFISLPSPIYGGDYYYQLGAVNHVKYGGNTLSSTNTFGELPVYLPLYSFMVGNFARILNINSIDSIYVFSYLITIFSALIIFLLIKKLFKDIFLSFISSLYFIMFMIGHPICKYTSFASVLMMPLFLYLTYRFLENKSFKNSIILGVVYGLTGLSHPSAFMASSLLMLLVFIYYCLIKNIEFKTKQIEKQKIKKDLFRYIIIFLIGISIALLWWFHPIFTFHAQSSHGYPELTFSINSQIELLWNYLSNIALNFNTIHNSIFSVFCILGIIGIIFTKTKNIQIEFLKFLIISTIIIIFHYFITENFFGFNLVPNYLISMLKISSLVLFSFGILICNYLIKNSPIKKKYFYSILILFLLISFFQLYEQADTNKWLNNAKKPLPEHMTSLSEYLIENTNVDDIILTTKEIGFAINAVSGRKLLTFRRGHAGPYQFTDLDTREITQTLLLYGNNTNLKKELLKKYDLKYLYWDNYWIQSEYTINEKGQVVGRFDPLVISYNKEYEKVIKQNGIKYSVETDWSDPSLRGGNWKKQKLIFVSPENYRNFTHPWNPDLNTFLEEVWSFKSKGEKTAILYKIIKE